MSDDLMPEATPGRAAHHEHYARFHGSYTPDVARKYAPEAWLSLGGARREDWHAVALAAIDAAIASGPQEAGRAVSATLIAINELVVAKDRAQAITRGHRADRLDGESCGLLAAADLIRERLAPAWNALAVENAGLRGSAQLGRMHHDELAASYRKLQAENEKLAEGGRQAEAERDAARKERDQLLDRLDRLEAECTERFDNETRYREALEKLAGAVDRFLVSSGLTVAELVHAVEDAREALEAAAVPPPPGGTEDEPGRYDAEGKWHPAGEPWPGDVSDLDEDMPPTLEDAATLDSDLMDGAQ